MNEGNGICKVICAACVLAIASIGGCSAATTYMETQAAISMQAKGAEALDIPCAIGKGTERYCEMRSALKSAKAQQ